MTREEAINNNKNLRMYMRLSDKNEPYKFLEENYIALDMAIKALEQEPSNDMVSRGVFEQVMWERDVAIEQLHELGYELGEKIRTTTTAGEGDTYKYLLHGAESLVKENPEAIEALQDIPTMYYPQVEGVTPTVVSTGKQEPFDEYGNYKYPSDFELTEPNTATSTPCGDAISRQAALDCFTATKLKKFDFILYARAEIKKLPPVNPQNCDTCEVGNPCLYCRHEFEPQERSE